MKDNRHISYMPASKEEEEFFKNYDSSIYKKPSVSVDGAIFARDKKTGSLKLLLIKRGGYPYKGCYCLPGGFIEIDEDLHDAVKREIKEETNIAGIEFEQVYTFGKPDRDPRQRTISVLYAAYSEDILEAQAGDDAAYTEWFTIEDYKSDLKEKNTREISLKLRGGVEISPKIIKTASNGIVKSKSVEIIETGGLAFDHAHVIIAAYEFILGKFKNK